MNEHQKIQPYHLERIAYLYIRQSSMRQVIENIESTKRQYALKTRALTLGWKDEQIILIDCDQGESGASSVGREGFQRLVTGVSLGQAGIVMGLEVSRLARNNADWHRLLEICALSGTLILDEDGVYDPTNFNDRLLLGLKGTMSEAELHIIKARLRGGLLNKVRRGEYRCALPTGFVYDLSGNVVLDPDSQVRETIAYFFETFSRLGSLSQTVKAFFKEGVLFPSRFRNGETIVFRQLTSSTAARTLHNPRYTGTYTYGRRLYRRTSDGTKITRKREANDWLACIPNAHPGYISWDQYQANLKLLESNGRPFDVARKSPPREGAALLQGRVVCGLCGSYMRARYAERRGVSEAWYVCDRTTSTKAFPYCQSLAAKPIDLVLGNLIAESMTPAAVQFAIDIRKEIEARESEADQLRQRAIERSQIEADMARRRFMMVDPGNRLVADALEAEWNEKLRAVSQAKEIQERSQPSNESLIDEATENRLIAMVSSFKELWADPSTSNRERKRMFSLIVEDVTLIKFPEQGITKIHVRYKGGKTETLTSENPKSSAQQVKTNNNVLQLIDNLLDDYTYSEIAKILNEKGFQPGGSARKGRKDAKFDASRVAYVAIMYRLKPRYNRLRERGMLTRQELADRLGVHSNTIRFWAKHGLVKAHAYNDHAFLFEDPGPHAPKKQCSRWSRLADRKFTGNHVVN